MFPGGHASGLLVRNVVTNSPAHRSGIEPNDILVKFEDQLLFTPEQFSALVKSYPTGQSFCQVIILPFLGYSLGNSPALV